MTSDVVTVFGGSGFLGRRVARRLRAHGSVVRIASRHTGSPRIVAGTEDPGLHWVQADIHDDAAVAKAVEGAQGVVNAVSLYAERAGTTFRSVHVEGARRVAAAARDADVAQLVHVSGIGADPTSSAAYISSRGEGEQTVREAFPDAIIVRPAVMFAADDNFLTMIVRLLRRLPVYPLFGSGETRLQPVHADDVAEAIALLARRGQKQPVLYEFGGPRVYTYAELLRSVADAVGSRAWLAPVPFGAWFGLTRIAGVLPNPPITRNQVELMQVDTTASADVPGLAALGITPRAVEEVAATLK
jgi:NADH dehydrogenase